MKTNKKKALKQYQAAAEHGSPFANYHLSQWYHNDVDQKDHKDIKGLIERSKEGFAKMPRPI